jgi:hypothetical protein
MVEEREAVRQAMLQLADRVMCVHELFRSNLIDLLTDMVTRSEHAFGNGTAEIVHD